MSATDNDDIELLLCTDGPQKYLPNTGRGTAAAKTTGMQRKLCADTPHFHRDFLSYELCVEGDLRQG